MVDATKLKISIQVSISIHVSPGNPVRFRIHLFKKCAVYSINSTYCYIWIKTWIKRFALELQYDIWILISKTEFFNLRCLPSVHTGDRPITWARPLRPSGPPYYRRSPSPRSPATPGLSSHCSTHGCTTEIPRGTLIVMYSELSHVCTTKYKYTFNRYLEVCFHFCESCIYDIDMRCMCSRRMMEASCKNLFYVW